ncbi:MAG: M20 family metallopeptidase [Chloroflexota bacterium]|nr:M20 family metallopeptidase [Chloroflexota bacterium]
MHERDFLAYLRPKQDLILAELATLSLMDCGTDNKPGVDAVGRIMRAKLESLGLDVEAHEGGDRGDTLVGRWRGAGRARLLLIGHLDTVYPPGWPREHPFHVEGDIARGPGTCDMKAGVLVGLYALDALRAASFDDFAEIAFILNGDEEVSSPVSSAVIAREALGRDAVLVLEAARENGDIVSARKGFAQFDLHVQGRAAHAGVEPEKGRHALLELAHQIVALQALNGAIPGATVNVGVAAGGMRRNIVPDEARAELDVRARDAAGMDAIIAALRARTVRTSVPDVTVTLEGGVVRAPMEKSAASARLVAWCQEAARALGFAVQDAATGGGSDANNTAALGAPTIDGLGPIGGLDHSPHEYITISSVVPRTAMLAGLIARICHG